MKKVLLSLSLGVLILTATSCKKDKAINCEEAANNFSAALTKYSNDDTKANCDALNVAAANYIDSECGNSLSAEQKALYKSMFDGDCE